MLWLLRAALFVLLLAGVAGCASPPAISVREWNVEGKPASLPGSIAPLLATRGGTIHMTAEVPLPPELQGLPISFAINVQWCSPVVSANGVVLDDVERTPLDGVRSQGPHLYRIPSAVAGERLSLRMEIPDTYDYCTLFPVAPSIARGDFGSASYVTVRRVNEITPLVSVGLLPALVAALLAVYFTGGRRASHLWAAVAAFFLIGMPVGFLGLSHYVLGYRGDAVYMMTALPCELAGLWFVCAYVALPPPSKVWSVIVACSVAAVPLTMSRHDEHLMWAQTQAVSIVLIGRMVWILVKYRARSRNALLLAAISAVQLPVALITNVPLAFGLPDPLEGAQLTYLGAVAFAATMLFAFMRDYGATALDLRAQLAASEARQREVLALSEELRHQVAQRSRELRDALVRTEGLLAPQRPSVGDLFEGRYLVLRELGAGGMGAVFEVERKSDGRRFALKVVTGHVTGEGAARFAREAEIGARMRHTNLVAIVDVGIARSTTPFLVMELVRGGSLESMRERFGDEEWGRPLLVQVAEALVALHANGIVHRDLKPGNVLLEEGSGRTIAKVADFGISRIDEPETPADALAATAANVSPHRLTGTGMMLGTPLYMAPEAATGPVGAPSDVFSFGVLAYEILAGRAPYAVPPVLLAMSTQPLPRPVGEAVGTMAIILDCLAADPHARPTSQAVVDALRDARGLERRGAG